MYLKISFLEILRSDLHAYKQMGRVHFFDITREATRFLTGRICMYINAKVTLITFFVFSIFTRFYLHVYKRISSDCLAFLLFLFFVFAF